MVAKKVCCAAKTWQNFIGCSHFEKIACDRVYIDITVCIAFDILELTVGILGVPDEHLIVVRPLANPFPDDAWLDVSRRYDVQCLSHTSRPFLADKVKTRHCESVAVRI